MSAIPSAADSNGQNGDRPIFYVASRPGSKERFTFHDIKAKGVTDHELKASGHRTKKMLEVYDRKPAMVPSTK